MSLKHSNPAVSSGRDIAPGVPARERVEMQTGLKTLSAEIAADPEMAWAMHCNIAMPIFDAANVSHEMANKAAAHLMQHLFGHDIRTDDRYAYSKSGAQQYAEMRIAADAAEDAEIARARQ